MKKAAARAVRGTKRAAKKPARKRRSADDDVLPTTWLTMDRATGTLREIKIAEMDDGHLSAAIAYCERKAGGFVGITRLSPIETARRLWPRYRALVAEAEQRFGMPLLSATDDGGRVVIMPHDDKEDT